MTAEERADDLVNRLFRMRIMLPDEAEPHIAAAIRAAVDEEREACAKKVDSYGGLLPVAAAIRDRGKQGG